MEIGTKILFLIFLWSSSGSMVNTGQLSLIHTDSRSICTTAGMKKGFWTLQKITVASNSLLVNLLKHNQNYYLKTWHFGLYQRPSSEKSGTQFFRFLTQFYFVTSGHKQFCNRHSKHESRTLFTLYTALVHCCKHISLWFSSHSGTVVEAIKEWVLVTTLPKYAQV